MNKGILKIKAEVNKLEKKKDAEMRDTSRATCQKRSIKEENFLKSRKGK